MRLSKFLTEDLDTKTVTLTLTFDERTELLKHLEVYDEHIDQLHPLVESVQDKLLGID
jgi:Trp operon repressor|tara:strand:+ start:140 stop:313 length:174 start_codon:yes stop_codon:yes gene_type:complete